MPLDDPTATAPAVRSLSRGREWSVSEYLCTAGPGDRPFEERHDAVSIAAVSNTALDDTSSWLRTQLASPIQ